MTNLFGAIPTPTGSLEIMGTNGTAVPQWNTLAAGTGIVLSQTGSVIEIENSGGGGSSGGVGWSPYQWWASLLSADTTVTTAYTSASPTLAQMQSILSITVTPALQNSVLTLEIIACDGVTGANSEAIMYGIFSSINTTTAIQYAQNERGKITSTTSGNFNRTSMVATIPSQNTASTQVPITITLAACLSENATTLSAPNPTVYSTASTNPFGGKNYTRIRIWEVVPNSDSILWVSELPIPAATTVTVGYTSPTQTTLTVVANESFYKQAANSVIQVRASIFSSGVSTGSYFSQLQGWVSPGFTTSGGGSYTMNTGSVLLEYAQGGFQLGTSSSVANGANVTQSLVVQSPSYVSTSPNYQFTGSFYVVIGGTYVGSEYTVQASPESYIEVAEVVPGVNDGLISVEPLTQISATVTATAPSYPWTSNIVKGSGTAVGSLFYTARAAGSTIELSGQLWNGSGASNAEVGILVAFWSGTTLVELVPLRAAASSYYNVSNIAWEIQIPSPGANVGTGIAVEAWIFDSASPSVTLNVNGVMRELIQGYLNPASLSSVVAASGSYLTASTSSGVATLNTTRASTSQAGLVSLASTPSANTVLRINNAGTIVSTVPPYFTPFGTSIRLQFGGANTGQVVGTQVGTAIYEYMGAALSTTETGFASTVYKLFVTISVNVTTLGTSTGAATLIGMPVTPVTGIFATPFYWPVQRVSGVALANNQALFVSYTSGSTTLSLWIMNTATGAYTAITKTAFTAPVQLRIVDLPIYTTTAPTN